MAKKVIKITEGELAEMIKDITLKSLNEMDGATYARIYNASHRAKQDNQKGILSKTYTIRNINNGTTRTKAVNNDDIMARARSMQTTAQQHWLKDYIGQTFKFYGEDRMGLIADILFTFEKVTKLDEKKTILVGTVTFNETQISGDGIIIDFTKNRILYHEHGNRYAYKLEVDNRTAPQWNKLTEQLKMALEHRDS